MTRALPFVSIVIPNLNNAIRLNLCLQQLIHQSYPKDLFEIIVVDNGSTDQSLEIIKKYPVLLIQELESTNPYICRNKGINKSRGSVIALIDSKCTPVTSWIEEGIKMMSQNTSLVAGAFQFEFSSKKTIYEMAYSILYLDNERAVTKGFGVPTGNLFIHKSVFQKIGLYPTDNLSAIDLIWSKSAIDNGFHMSYAKQAICYYPAKDKTNILKSAKRDGIANQKLLDSKEYFTLLLSAFRTMLPMKPWHLREIIERKGYHDYKPYFFQIWLVIWRIKLKVARAILGLP